MAKQPATTPATSSAASAPAPVAWRNRIVGNASVAPATLSAHDKNWRKHPAAQVAALRGAISELGFIRSVTVNKRTDRIIDGHARLKLAIETKQPTIPVEYVDLSPEEERLALATLDSISAMAETDRTLLDDLLSDLSVQDAGLRSMLEDLHAGDDVDEIAAELEGEEPEEIEVRPPPAVVWVLMRVPLASYPQAQQHLALLEKIANLTVQSNRDD